MKDPAKVAQALLDNHCREYPAWRNCAEMRALKVRIAEAIRNDRAERGKGRAVRLTSPTF